MKVQVYEDFTILYYITVSFIIYYIVIIVKVVELVARNFSAVAR